MQLNELRFPTLHFPLNHPSCKSFGGGHWTVDTHVQLFVVFDVSLSVRVRLSDCQIVRVSDSCLPNCQNPAAVCRSTFPLYCFPPFPVPSSHPFPLHIDSTWHSLSITPMKGIADLKTRMCKMHQRVHLSTYFDSAWHPSYKMHHLPNNESILR